MHPIEHLRYLARSSGWDAEMLVPEAAVALAAFADDRAALVMAARTLLARQPVWGSLWWACGRIVSDTDPRVAAEHVLSEWDADPTGAHLHRALEHLDDLPRPRIRCIAAGGRDSYLVVDGDHGLCDGGDHTELWLTAGIGSIVPEPIWQRILAALPENDGPASEVVQVAASQVARIATPQGLRSPDRMSAPSDVPVVPELMRFA